jgi:hypothetical protein
VTAALLQLQWKILRGRLVRWTRLLRQPKYLAGTVIGACWMAFWLARFLLHANVPVHFGGATRFPEGLTPTVHQLAGLVVMVLLAVPWLLPWGRLGLPFREAELTLLLQAPLSRRQVIHYGLLKSSLSVLISASFVGLFLGVGGPLDRVRVFLGAWMLFLFWDLNSKWRALFLLRQREVSRATALFRRAGVTLGIGALLLSLGASAMRVAQVAFEQLRGAGDLEALVARLAAAPWPPLLSALTTPARWLTGPALAEGWGAFALAALPVVALIVVQRELVLRCPARFEESALAQARSRDTWRARSRRSRRSSPWGRRLRTFPLPSAGEPAVAVLWKNLMRVSRVPLVHAAGAVVALIVLLAGVPALMGLDEVIYGVMIVLGLLSSAVILVLGGMSWHNDLRSELAHSELVRTWPLPPRRLVAAEVVSPALLGFLTACACLGVSLAGFLGSRLRAALLDVPSRIDPGGPTVPFLGSGSGTALLVLLGLLPLLAGAMLVSSAMHNLMVLVVPAWMAQGPDASRGIAAFGQRLLLATGVFLGFALALIPSAALVGLAALAQWALGIGWTFWTVPLWGLLAAMPLLVESWLLVGIAARLWEALDPSEEVLESGR